MVRLRRSFRFLGMVLALLPASCGPSNASLQRLAAQGEIQRNAAITAEASMTIGAPPETVWRLLTDVDGWPRWFPGVSEARIEGPLAAGTRFLWTKRDKRIESRLALVEAPRRLTWSGSSGSVQAIRVITLEDQGDGRTEVHEAESLDGWLIRWVTAPGSVEGNLRVELAALRREAERAARSPP